MTVHELGAQIRARKISCVELIQRTLDDIQARDKFCSLITVTGEQALATARERDAELAAGTDRGPFHGIPIALKDLFYTRGVRTTAGSLIYKDFVPDYDATVVEQLHDAGAISIGKTNLHEIAFGITSKNPHFGLVLNPLDPKRLAGGSSGGSAALVAGGFLPMALGTDTGGSIRVPASFCGIAGLKPTYGLVSRHGVLPLGFSLDHVGPLGSCVEDCALALNAMTTGEDYNVPAPADLKGLRVGVPIEPMFGSVMDDVLAAVETAVDQLQKLGADVQRVTTPSFVDMNTTARTVQLAETAAVYVNHQDKKQFGADVWSLLEQGRMIMGHEYVNGQRLRQLFRLEFDKLWTTVDVLVGPTTPMTAPTLDRDTVIIQGREENVRMAATRLVRAVNLLGEPALSIPCGKGSEGMPVGLQLIAAPFAEKTLVKVGKALEQTLGKVGNQ
jgi:aspartyl-tRNA(Asn)/glutamyl-tRNA(Gln) amidotransferase subunit A